MKKYPNIDYTQRPETYWNDAGVLAALLRNVKGRERREMIRAYYEEGRLEELDETFLQETLGEGQRERLGRIHPMFMGGEYLPDYEKGEVEIARIELDSTTRDVISIRGRRQGKQLTYRIVDEYDTKFELGRERSDKPLTLEELIELIDNSWPEGVGTGLALCYNEMNEEGTGERESLRDFARVSSDFYPQLYEHYENVYDDWVEEGRDREPQAESEGGEGTGHGL